jgi:hypothetical protein
MENTVGSLTEEQRSILIGTLLGDGTLRKKTNTLLEVNHSSKQKEYVFWLYSKFEEYVNNPPKIRINGFNRTSYRFITRSISALNEYYESFYANRGQKTVPENLRLGSLSLAVWFMDDGSKSRNAVYLNTQQFTLSDQESLRNLLEDDFGFRVTLNRDKSYFRLRLSCNSTKGFCNLISPILLDSMRYKLP